MLACTSLLAVLAPLFQIDPGLADRRVEGEPFAIRRVTDTEARNVQLAFSPDGSRVAFISNRSGSWQLHVMGTDGTGERRLTELDDPAGWPSWTPDGETILFYATGPDRSRMLRLTLTSGELAELPAPTRRAFRPEVSPDGARILFDAVADDADGPWHQIWVMDTDGADRRPLTSGRAYHSDARWSPDGRRLVFHTGEHGPPDEPFAVMELHVMAPDGSGETRLTHDEARNTYPAWSPDGRRLAFTKEVDGNSDIWVMDADGSEPQRLTHHPGRDTTPCWEPGGRAIWFSSGRDPGTEDLYVVVLDAGA